MKKTIILTVALSLLQLSNSMAAFGDEVLINASCRIYCLTGAKDVSLPEGNSRTEKKIDVAYKDFAAMTLADIDKNTEKSSLDVVCQSKFPNKAGFKVESDGRNCVFTK
jgi:hypothetical protein